jgi:hypothetical protein
MCFARLKEWAQAPRRAEPVPVLLDALKLSGGPERVNCFPCLTKVRSNPAGANGLTSIR